MTSAHADRTRIETHRTTTPSQIGRHCLLFSFLIDSIASLACLQKTLGNIIILLSYLEKDVKEDAQEWLPSHIPTSGVDEERI